MGEEIKRFTAHRRSASVLDVFRQEIGISEARRNFGLHSSETESYDGLGQVGDGDRLKGKGGRLNML